MIMPPLNAGRYWCSGPRRERSEGCAASSAISVSMRTFTSISS
jgi:hypothetical protein